MLKRGSDTSETIFDIDAKKIKIKELEYEMAEQNFWQDREQAEKKSKQLANLKSNIEKWENMSDVIDDLLELAKTDKEDKTVNIRVEIEQEFKNIEKQLLVFEKLTFLKGKYDQKNAYLSIFAGAGGVDAQDWAEMLLRMYVRYGEDKGWDVRIIDESKGSEAGIKSVTVVIEGEFAYGFLKSEAGVHRLVRISPFDAEKMRHTSFALVEVLPEIEDVEAEINPDDLRIDTFLSSGPGGQHMQKTESAVRIMHVPTKLTAVCQSERSQHQNKEQAMKILKTKLYHFYSAEKEEEKDRLRGEFKSASWGNQIRSYVLHPYKMVKDLRTKYETNDAQSILDGDLDEIIESNLKQRSKI
ncbi:peptide chain release factor 2 [Patescibacteria group bacterium AH-259-L05]|nr:peptide chain release factor 2 [Patescibacteria group bacterium AH-259-L05]